MVLFGIHPRIPNGTSKWAILEMLLRISQKDSVRNILQEISSGVSCRILPGIAGITPGIFSRYFFRDSVENCSWNSFRDIYSIRDLYKGSPTHSSRDASEHPKNTFLGIPLEVYSQISPRESLRIHLDIFSWFSREILLVAHLRIPLKVSSAIP